MNNHNHQIAGNSTVAEPNPDTTGEGSGHEKTLDAKIIDALYRDTPPTLPRPMAGMPMADFWQSTVAGDELLILLVNVSSKLHQQLVAVAIRCAKEALETAQKEIGDALGDRVAPAAQAIEVAERWLRGDATHEQVNRAMNAIAFANSGPRPDLSLALAAAAELACRTTRNAGRIDENMKNGLPDQYRIVAKEAHGTQCAAITALVEAGVPLDEARQRTIKIVREELPWSVVEPHALALVGGAHGPVA
jgi:hypothetical protein